MCFCIRSYNAIEDLRGKNGNSLSTNAGCNVLLILTLQMEITILFFVCLFWVFCPAREISLRYWRKAAKFDLYYELMAIQDSLACHTYSDNGQLFI